jgi:hypothetical protein
VNVVIAGIDSQAGSLSTSPSIFGFDFAWNALVNISELGGPPIRKENRNMINDIDLRDVLDISIRVSIT